MRIPTPRATRRRGHDAADLPNLIVPSPAGPTDAAARRELARPVSWSVPRGVRTASEWAWRVIIIAVAVGLGLYLLAQLSEIVIPILIAMLLTALLFPLTRFFTRWMPRGAGAGLTLLGTIGGISAVLSFVGSQFVDQLPDITKQVGAGYEQLRTYVQDTFGISDSQIDQYIQRARDELSSSGAQLGQTAAKAGLTAGHFLTGLVLTLFALFFFLYEGERIWSWAVGLFPRAARERVHSSGVIAWGQLSAFTRATVIVAGVDAVGIAGVAAILGVPFATGIGVLVFFGAFVPIIGAFLSGTVAVLLALVALGPVKALIMLGGVLAVQQLESHVLQPFILGRSVRVHPLAVIFGIAAGIILAGITGALIAVPVLAVVNAVGHHLLDADPDDDPATSELLTETEQDAVEGAVAESKDEASTSPAE